jgi:hypothetical protein
MLRQTAKILSVLSDATRPPATSAAGDWHDTTGHHRYYGSSACNGGERIVDTSRGPRPAPLNLFAI